MNRRQFLQSAGATALLVGCGRAGAQSVDDGGSHIEAVTASGLAYRLFLPPGYHDEPNTRCSVLLHLHGAGATWTGLLGDVNATAETTTAGAAAGALDQMIIVAPHDETGWSMWADSHDGSAGIAGQVLDELIPEIDATYRTWPVPECRVIQGFSMGGFGAATMLFKHPEVFGAGIVWDGAMHDWDTLTANRSHIANDQFGGSQAFFEQWSPWEMAMHPESAGQPLMVVRGGLGSFYDRYTGHLIENGHEPNLMDAACGHDMACLTESAGGEAVAFLAEVIGG